MKRKALTIVAGTMLLAGSAALYGMSLKGDIAVQGAGPGSPARVAPPALSVVVTTHRATPGRSAAWTHRGPAVRSAAWTAPATIARGSDRRPDPQS